MQTISPSTPKVALRNLNILFYAILTGMVFMGGVFIFLGTKIDPVLTERKTVNVILIVILLAATVFITIADRIYKKRIKDSSRVDQTLTEKLGSLRGAMIVYLAACEGIGIFAYIIYFLTGKYHFLAVAGLIILGMLMKQPGKSRIFNDLQLNAEEQMELNN